MQNVGGPGSSIADVIRRKLEQARDQLVDRNLRNRLVNCPLTSTRSRQIRVVDERTDQVFQALTGQRKQLSFVPGRERATAEQDTSESDQAVWIPPENDTPGTISARHSDSLLQTQLTREGLQKRLSALYYESIEAEEEQGVNVLFLALGFLKWFDDARSEMERFAPLLLLPVELTREGARDKFKIKLRDEDLNVNVSLKLWLAEQHSVQLPDFPDRDDWQPSEYFSSVKKAIRNTSRWEVLEDSIVLGFFSFSKFLLWRDLDPKNWPTADSLLGHGILRKILAPSEEDFAGDSPVIPADARIDNLFKSADLPYVVDADSSQTTAIQTAMQGRNLVIQGPPGTGKSQTISNLIAAAVHSGKSVLFVAEKMAALEVVHQRLLNVGLAPICLELHSRRAAKQQVLRQIRMALDAPVPSPPASNLPASVDKQVGELWAHSDRFHAPNAPSSYTPFETAGAICRLQDLGVAVPDFQVTGAESLTRSEIEELKAELRSLAERLVVSGVPARHPWRGCRHPPFNPLELERLSEIAGKLSTAADALVGLVKKLWPLVCRDESTNYADVNVSQLSDIAHALQVASRKPGERMELLCNERWTRDLEHLLKLQNKCERLTSIAGIVDATFVEQALQQNWVDIRAELAGHGQSYLRFFRKPYRNSIGRYRGFCRNGLPKTFQERLEALDRLIEYQKLRDEVNASAEPIKNDLGDLWAALPNDWKRLQKLTSWLTEANGVDRRLAARNVALIGWDEDPKTWSDRLLQIANHVELLLKAFTARVQIDNSLSMDRDKAFTTVCGLAERAKEWKESPERYNEWPPVVTGLDRLLKLTGEKFYSRVYRGQIQPADLANRVLLAVLEQVWNSMCRAENKLAQADGRILDNTLSSFRDLDRKWIRSAASEVARKHYDRKPNGTAGEMGILRLEVNKKSRLLPVRKLVDTAGHALQRLKPVFLMSPLSVAQYLSPGHLKFDLLIIDEASQVRPEDALGAAARADQIVVVGDGKQLPPTNFFNRIVADIGEDEDEDGAVDNNQVAVQLGAMESILSLCDSTLSNRCMLSWHYRSQHPALIAVSNRNFYDGKLLLPPSTIRGHSAHGLGVVFRRTRSGGYDRGRSAKNVLEAQEVAKSVARFARENPGKSLGVGTFSVAQRDAIRDLVEQERRDDPSLESFFATGKPQSFFVKNLESIQGDERDVIFISVGYGRDQDGRLTASFGPINNDGGERRLNVLISRARERCEVFSSITAEEVDARSGKPGVIALREFLQFAEKGYFDVPRVTNRDFDSDFEESVATFIVKSGFQVEPQVGMAGFYVDIGVISPSDPNRFVLGIECDGATYHSSRSARDRDRIRQEILESRGWRIHRIWSTDWFHRRNEQERKLADAIALACSQPDSAPQSKRDPPLAPDESSRTVDRAKAPVRERTTTSTQDYKEAHFRVHSQVQLHDASPDVVEDAVARVVRIEGPIHTDEIARRLASVWGLDRAGSRIHKKATDALRRLAIQKQLAKEGHFWSLTEGGVRRVRNRGNAESPTIRKAEYLPPSEIGWAIEDILDESVRVHEDELVVEVARRFGFQRTGEDLQDVIGKTLRRMIGTQIERDEMGFLRRSSGSSA